MDNRIAHTVTEHRAQGETFPGLRDHGREDWFILPIVLRRDSEALERSNWRTVLRDLGGESDTLEVHRWRHWACGWYELAIIHPTRRAEADKWAAALADYPCADEMDYSEAEAEDAAMMEDAEAVEG